jgi:alpha-amylase/alpha-mannosidase (GH57 family)
MKKIFVFFLLAFLTVSSCTPVTPQPTPVPPTVAVPTEAPPPDLYVAIIWHQHQPFYATDPETGLFVAPWVRLHAAKDYVDMAAMVADYPNVHVTFNLTPSLIGQLDELAAGKRDLAWEMTLIPADQLTVDQKTYLLQRFFDANGKVIARFPRYEELMDMRGGTSNDQIMAALENWTAQDFRDLQVLFNLAWTDPDYLAEEPLAALVKQGRGFSEADKQIVLDKHLEFIKKVVAVHRDLQDIGQIEVTTTPYAHPILPLLIDTELAKIAVPDIVLPPRFSYGRDAVEQLERGVELYVEHFGQMPRGMWPAEGSVAEEIVGPVYRAGIQWIVTDEAILAESLGLDFTRDASGLPANLEQLYQPYQVAERDDQPVAILFRDTLLSNKVSFDYSQLDAQTAIDDFIGRIHAIRDALKAKSGGPYLLTVILDGENAWEWYDNDGKDFLNGIYTALNDDASLKMVTPSEFLSMNPGPLPVINDLFAGSWDGGDFQTWIGEPEENKGWTYLGTARAELEEYLRGSKKGQVNEEQLARATEAILAAEGSDWFWWFGADKDSGNDAAFDAQFRETLGQMYDALALPRPDYLSVPVIYAAPIEPGKALEAVSSPIIDGQAGVEEWAQAGRFDFGEVQPSSLGFAFSKELISLVLGDPPQENFSIYLKVPAIPEGAPFSIEGRQVLEMDATHRVKVESGGKSAILQKWEGKDWADISDTPVSIQAGSVLEMSFAHSALWPTLDAGDALLLRIASDRILLPRQAPGRLLVPDLGRINWLVQFTDPAGDDHGPGAYMYPSDGVFVNGVFDLLVFQVGSDENNLVFKAEMRGPVDNPWGSPNGLAIQTIDVYLDVDGPASGARLLRSARNAAVSKDYAWDYALTISGWQNGLFTSNEPEKADINLPLTIITDPGRRSILVKIPRDAIPGDPTQWAYAVLVMSQDGYGPNGIRDVLPVAERWRIGGGPQGATNMPRILDYLWPEGALPTQEEMLSAYTPVETLVSDLGPEDFAQLEMVRP